MKRLSQATGNLVAGDDANVAKRGTDVYDRPGIIVHAGEFMSKDGAITFDAARIRAMVDRNNAYLDQLKKEYNGNAPLGAYPPILGNHNGDTISLGRCLGPYVYEERDLPKVGKKVPCMVSKHLRFIGETNAMMAQDGRIYHLSGGVDENDGDLITEVSAVPDPAAPGAMLLSRGRGHLPAKPKRETMQASKGRDTATAQAKNLRGNSMQITKSLEALKRLSGELKSKKVELVKAKTDLEFARSRDDVDGKLRNLVRLGKMTPGEYRKVADKEGITRLAKMSKEARDAYFEAHNMREGQLVQVGQRGSQDAIEAGMMAQEIGEAKLTRLSRETRADLKRMGAKLKNDAGDDAADEGKGVKRLSAADRLSLGMKRMSDGASSEVTAEMEGKYAECMKALEAGIEKGDLDEAKKHLAALKSMGGKGMKHMAAGDVTTAPSDLASQKIAMMEEQIANLMGVVDRIAAEVEKIVAAEQVEGEQAEAVAESHEELAAGEKEGEAEMAAADQADSEGKQAEMAEGDKDPAVEDDGKKALAAGDEADDKAKQDEKK